MSRIGWGIGLLALANEQRRGRRGDRTNMAALRGLAPVSALSNSADGKAALASNFTVTGGIQTGAIRQPTLLPFTDSSSRR